jgi:hypothetical protein
MEKSIKYINKYYKYKKKYLQLKTQIGGLFNDYEITALDKIRFTVNKSSNFLEIIDNNYNNKYEFKLLNDFYILIDEINKVFYAFNKNCDEIKIDTPEYQYIIEKMSKAPSIFKLLSYNIRCIRLEQTTGCYNPINLQEIKEFILTLNKKISTKCPELKLIIDNYRKLPGKNIAIFWKKII